MANQFGFLPNCRYHLEYDPNYYPGKKSLAKPYSVFQVLSWNVYMPQSLFVYLTKISSTIRTSQDVIYIKKKTFQKKIMETCSAPSDSNEHRLFMENYEVSIDYILIGGNMQTDHVLNLKNGKVYSYSLDIEYPYLCGLILRNETFYQYVNEYIFGLKN